MITDEQKQSIEEGSLDEAVHDAASLIASRVNNQGPDAQRSYLQEDSNPSEDLDEAVHQRASEGASEINNEGVDAQIRFLVSQGYSDDDVLREAQDED